MPYFFHVTARNPQIVFLTDCGPNRAASLETVWAGGRDGCVVLGIAYLGAAGFYCLFFCGRSYSVKKAPNSQVTKLFGRDSVLEELKD